MAELTEEKKATINAMLSANPSLADELKKALGIEEEAEEDVSAKDPAVDDQLAAMKEALADLQKPSPDETKALNLDPTDTGDPTWGFGKGTHGLGEFALDVVKWSMGEPSERLLKVKNAQKAAGAGLQENVDSEGGFLIPTEQRQEILTVGIEKADLMSKVTPIPMSSNMVKINYIKDTDRSSGLIHGGVRFYYVAEEGTTTATKPALGQITLSLNKLFGLAYATSELIEDSPVTIGPWLSQVFADAFPYQMDYDILNGSGTGMPEGILNSAALISQTAETDQEATTIVAENILNMYSRMPSANRRNAIWLANEDTFMQLATMTIDVGTGGVPVYLPANGLANQPFDTLMGKQIIFTEHCQTLGTVGDIYFIDPTQYLLGTRSGGGLRADQSIHLKFETDETAFRFIYRVDGRSWWPSAVTPRISSVTLSPFIALATRS